MSKVRRIEEKMTTIFLIFSKAKPQGLLHSKIIFHTVGFVL